MWNINTKSKLVLRVEKQTYIKVFEQQKNLSSLRSNSLMRAKYCRPHVHVPTIYTVQYISQSFIYQSEGTFPRITDIFAESSQDQRNIQMGMLVGCGELRVKNLPKSFTCNITSILWYGTKTFTEYYPENVLFWFKGIVFVPLDFFPRF